MIKNILITGMPRSGKSTLLKEIISKYKDKVGFVTNEIRIKGEREGFEIETSKGVKEVLSHISFKTPLKVSKYYVDIKKLEKVLSQVSNFGKEDILYIDEIGQMQLFSDNFKNLVEKYLDSNNIFIGTISKVHQDNFTEKLLKRKDVILIEINEQNRAFQKTFIEILITKIKKAQTYISERKRFSIEGSKAKMQSTHAERNLILVKGYWKCDCDFFKKYNICSHTIAIGDIASNN